MNHLAPELLTKISLAVGTAAIAAAQGMQDVAPEPVSLAETGLAAAGGLAGGLLLLRTADPARAMTRRDKVYTATFSGIIGAIVGPPFTNFATAAGGFLSEGLFENLGGGFLAGALVPVLFGVALAFLRWGKDNPDKLVDVARGLTPWGKK